MCGVVFVSVQNKETTELDSLCDANNYLEHNDLRDLEVKTHLLSLLRRNERM